MKSISTQFTPETLEAPARAGQKRKHVTIGVPKDLSSLEKRVPLTPGAVSVLVNNGHHVLLESGAGSESHFYNNEYSEAGAEIVGEKKDVYKADIVVKMAPPSLEDIALMQQEQTLLSPVQLPTLNTSVLEGMMKKRITAFAFEYIRDESGSYPIVRSMSEIAGSTAILIASEYLSHHFHGKGILLGGISGVAPARVVILGAGTVGEFATRTALGLGATVKVFDNSIFKLMRLQNNIGTRVFTSVIDPDVLMSELRTADVAVGAIHSPSGRAPVVVTEQIVAQMKSGSVIVDVSIDQGGCFETSEVTTHDKPTFKKYDVIHYAVPNIPSRVSRTASYAVSSILHPTILDAVAHGGIDRYLRDELPVRSGVYLYKGVLVNRSLGERFKLKFTDLNLLLSRDI
jgi:alanine dehydrogenase